MSAVAQGVDEPAGVLKDVAVVVHERHGVLDALDLVEELRVVLRGAQQRPARVFLLLADGLDGSGLDGLSAPDADSSSRGVSRWHRGHSTGAMGSGSSSSPLTPQAATISRSWVSSMPAA